MTEDMRSSPLSDAEREFVAEARRFLEEPSMLIRAADLVGVPLDRAQKLLPPAAREAVGQLTHKALRSALETGVKTLALAPVATDWEQALSESKRTGRLHTAIGALTGFAGGLGGLPGLLIELPASTIVMLRSIADIARRQGRDLSQPETQLECLYVFTLGSRKTGGDDEMDTSYFTARAAFADLIRNAAAYMAKHSAAQLSSDLASGSAPALVRLISAVAGRYGLVVNQKAVSQALPILGAIGGATINAAFTDYFNRAAYFHFGLRALEDRYGAEAVREAYGRS